jgi:uncharacterized protein YfcZ (UPF0381/DUF406 family)
MAKTNKRKKIEYNGNQIEEFLEKLIKKVLKRINSKDCQPKVSDALKAIQLKQKLRKTSEAEKIFWELIEKIRKEELERLNNKNG